MLVSAGKKQSLKCYSVRFLPLIVKRECKVIWERFYLKNPFFYVISCIKLCFNRSSALDQLFYNTEL